MNPLAEGASPPSSVSYSELARLFIRLSLSAFGGPVAHIAMAEDEIVARRRWLTREHYLDLVAATNLIPGPNSTEVMIHVGYVTRGIPGALLTGICFIGPTFLLTVLLSALYVSSGAIPQISAVLWGIKPVIVAIIAHVGYRLALTALKDRALWVLCLLSAAVIAWTPVPEVLVMVGAGLAYMLIQNRAAPKAAALLALPRLSSETLTRGLWFAAPYTVAVTAPVSLSEVFFYFLKIGSVLFGSGYILIAYIQQDVVNTFGWLTSRQLLDAVAIGQTTPGPVLTTVTVIGYIIAGLPGAVAATVGVFLPSFVLVILTAPLIPRMRQSRWLGAFLSGVNAGVIAAILITLLDLAAAALRTPDNTAWSPLAVVLVVASLALLIRYKINATWLIIAGGMIGGLLAG